MWFRCTAVLAVNVGAFQTMKFPQNVYKERPNSWLKKKGVHPNIPMQPLANYLNTTDVRAPNCRIPMEASPTPSTINLPRHIKGILKLVSPSHLPQKNHTLRHFPRPLSQRVFHHEVDPQRWRMDSACKSIYLTPHALMRKLITYFSTGNVLKKRKSVFSSFSFLSWFSMELRMCCFNVSRWPNIITKNSLFWPIFNPRLM